jgi:hypothetical protein
MEHESLTTSPPIRPLVLRVSLGVAFVTWIVLSVAAVGMQDRTALLVCIAGWPVMYCFWLSMSWLMATVCSMTDKPSIWGPAKNWQLRMMRGPMVWFVNAAIVILPAAVLLAGILGLLGVLPDRK